MGDFNPGDRVTWKSQAAGIWREKTGIVEAVVPAHGEPNDALQLAGTRGKVDGPGMSRSHESYVVRAGGRLYWPRVSLLKAAGEENAHG